ncbi:MAG TPA: hypothetical protein VOA80_17465 [Thermoanaerobaculia bacterium]|nr:hypothetical protein [Thermoanaerobaculia bacterium]
MHGDIITVWVMDPSRFIGLDRVEATGYLIDPQNQRVALAAPYHMTVGDSVGVPKRWRFLRSNTHPEACPSLPPASLRIINSWV